MKDIQVITGCMFAGKTTELINRLRSVKGNYLLIKPIIDNRDSGDQVLTHSGIVERAMRVTNISDIFPMLNNIDFVGIDEAQFFKPSIVNDIQQIKSLGIKVIIAGLEKDYLNNPFGSMESIIKLADSITRLTAVCSRCERSATHSHRKHNVSKDQFLIGNDNLYEALCKICFDKLSI